MIGSPPVLLVARHWSVPGGYGLPFQKGCGSALCPGPHALTATRQTGFDSATVWLIAFTFQPNQLPRFPAGTLYHMLHMNAIANDAILSS